MAENAPHLARPEDRHSPHWISFEDGLSLIGAFARKNEISYEIRVGDNHARPLARAFWMAESVTNTSLILLLA